MTDEPALAITANRFISNSTDCPAVVDSFFTWLVADPAHPPPSNGPFDRRLVASWRSWFSATDYIVLSHDPFRIPWTQEFKLRLKSDFRQVPIRGATVYRRLRR